MISKDSMSLGENRYAIPFQYHMVTERTVYMALPRELKGKQIKFAPETSEQAGTKRMDSEEILRAFPVECALVRTANKPLSKYILIEVV